MIAQIGIVNLILLLVLASGAYRGWKQGAIEMLSPFFALVCALLTTKTLGDDFIWNIYVFFTSRIRGVAGDLAGHEIEDNANELYADALGEKLASDFAASLGFLIGFLLLVLLFRVLLSQINSRRIPVVGTADSAMGAVAGLIAKMCYLWVIFYVVKVAAAGSAGVAEVVNNMNGGLFTAIYNNNPVGTILQGGILQ